MSQFNLSEAYWIQHYAIYINHLLFNAFLAHFRFDEIWRDTCWCHFKPNSSCQIGRSTIGDDSTATTANWIRHSHMFLSGYTAVLGQCRGCPHLQCLWNWNEIEPSIEALHWSHYANALRRKLELLLGTCDTSRRFKRSLFKIHPIQFTIQL